MPKRCTLISPTNLLLEQPILSPVEDPEFVLFGRKEFDRIVKRIRVEALGAGVILGFAIAAVIALIASVPR
jgi:hypothetical protein